MSISILTLFTPETATRIFNLGINIAKTLGLPVDSWRTGDPTKSMYKYVATKLAAVDQTVANLARSAVLSALVAAANNGDAGAVAWLKIVALEVYGIEVQEATFATSAAGTGVTLTNGGGGNFPIDPGDITFKSTVTGKTYHNTTGGTLAPGPGTTLVLEFVADEAGSDSTVAADEIDEMVTTLLGVTVTASVAAIGLDEESPSSIEQRCRDSLGGLSPNGPEDVYRFVARNTKYTGLTSITRAFSVDNEDGTVTVYIAGPSGDVSGGDVTAVQAAIDTWATPNCVTATVESAVGVEFDVTCLVAYSGSLSTPELESAISTKLATYFAGLDIGGQALLGGGNGVASSALVAAIMSIEGVTAASVATSDTELAPNEVATFGDLSVTEA